MSNEEVVSMRGTQDGLVFYLDDEASFNAVFTGLEKLFEENIQNLKSDGASIILELGYRYLKADQKADLIDLIENRYKFNVEKIQSNVVSKEKLLLKYNQTQLKIHSRIVRSGQVLSVEGDLLLIGDVNPGGKVEATGSILIFGEFHGIAHAGLDGDNDSVVMASYMNPTQIRIASYISRAPDYETDGVYLETAFVDEETKKIVLNKQKTYKILEEQRLDFERSVLNG